MQRYNETKKASILGIIGNIFLLIIKSLIGFATNSQAMIADAFNSAGDIFTSIMTYIGNKIASKPSDHDHNLGHGKAEYIFSMIISIVMGATALIVLKDSVVSIFNPEKYKFSIYLIVVCLVTIITKFILFIYTNTISKKYNNLLLLANSKDHRNDCVITLLNLISVIFLLKNIYFVDGIVGTIISTWIFITAIKIFMESYNVLMDKSLDKETIERIYQIINKYDDIKKVIHFNSTPVGYQYQITFTIYLDGNMSTFESHKIANDLEKEIDKEIDEVYLTVIHVNPYEGE